MKKLIVALMSLFLVGGVASAELTKKQEKQVDKEVKAKVKEYKKEGWKVFGTSRTLDSAVKAHVAKLVEFGDDAYEVVGISGNFKSKNIGKQQAENSACISYGQMAGSTLKGRIIDDAQINASDETSAEEFDRFFAAYERLVEKEIKNEMRESYSVIREVAGANEIQTFFIVNENAASLARMRALENAAKEAELASRHASSIADFVRKGFDK